MDARRPRDRLGEGSEHAPSWVGALNGGRATLRAMAAFDDGAFEVTAPSGRGPSAAAVLCRRALVERVAKEFELPPQLFDVFHLTLMIWYAAETHLMRDEPLGWSSARVQV